MSDSPKTTNASLAEELRRQAREERAARAREEAARRAAEQERQALMRRDRLREETGTQCVSLLGRLSALEAGESGRFVPSDAASELRARVRQATDDSRAAGTEADARAVQRRAGELAAQLDRLAAQANSTARTADQLGTEVGAAEAELNRMVSSPSARHILPAGAEAGWAQSLGRIRQSVVAAGDAETVRRCAADLSGVRGEMHRAGADADAALQEAQVTGSELRRLSSDIDTFARGPLNPHAEPGRVDALAGTVERLTDDLGRASGRAAVSEVRREGTVARDDFQQTAETAAANQRSAHLAAEAQVAARLRGEIGGLDPARCQKFDAAGWTDLQARVAAADRHLGRGELEDGRRALAAARTAFDAHRGEVARRFQRWQAERDAAAQAVAEDRAVAAAARGDDRRVRFIGVPLHDLDRRLHEVDRQIGREEFGPARAAATAVTQEAVRLGALADQLAAEAERLAELRARAGSAQPVAGRTFDANGARDTVRHLDAADAALKGGKLADAQQQLAAARDRFARHERAARDAAERWQKDHDESAAALAAGRARLDTLRDDPVVGRWQTAGLAEWDRQLAQAAADLGATRGDPDLDGPRFATARRVVASLTAAEPKLAEDANRLQVQADLQEQIGRGVIRVMEELGFAVAHGLENPADPRSAIVLQASRDNGDLIDVAVEHEGKIEYVIGGRLEKTEEVGAFGQTVRKCDQAEEQILRMHEMLLQLGIETDGLKWDDQPPPDSSGAAAALPPAAQVQNKPRTRAAGDRA